MYKKIWNDLCSQNQLVDIHIYIDIGIDIYIHINIDIDISVMFMLTHASMFLLMIILYW